MQHFEIEPPPIPSDGLYYFTTDHGIRYEVRFGRKKNEFSGATIVFGVLNEEFDGDEYSMTGKGDVYRVIHTIIAIVHHYLSKNNHIESIDFTGEPMEYENENASTKRIRVFKRFADRVAQEYGWKVKSDINSIRITTTSKK